jgi:hypothetical protein
MNDDPKGFGPSTVATTTAVTVTTPEAPALRLRSRSWSGLALFA